MNFNSSLANVLEDKNLLYVEYYGAAGSSAIIRSFLFILSEI